MLLNIVSINMEFGALVIKQIPNVMKNVFKKDRKDG